MPWVWNQKLTWLSLKTNRLKLAPEPLLYQLTKVLHVQADLLVRLPTQRPPVDNKMGIAFTPLSFPQRRILLTVRSLLLALQTATGLSDSLLLLQTVQRIYEFLIPILNTNQQSSAGSSVLPAVMAAVQVLNVVLGI